MGESFGAWNMGNDAEIMPLISSVNIACGFHAGDANTIAKTIDLATENGVAIGAHPSFPDLQGFGRRNMSLKPAEIYNLVAYQTAALKGMCEAKGAKLRHVKPHGALYNLASSDRKAARAICEAVRDIDADLILFGLSGSALVSEAALAGLTAANEVYADRSYQNDGMLTPRDSEGAMITDPTVSVSQVLEMVKHGTVTALDGTSVNLNAETICIHGDGEKAFEFTKLVRKCLDSNGIAVEPV